MLRLKLLRSVMSKVYCGLGSNIGDRLGYLAKAAAMLNAHPECSVKKSSPVYETAPMGEESQNNYFNATLEIETSLNVRKFHALIKSIEREIGREETYHWGPRKIDIDLLFFDDLIIRTPELTVPHSGITERDFVLTPLLDIAPDITFPRSGKKLSEFIIGLTNYYILNKVLENLSEFEEIE